MRCMPDVAVCRCDVLERTPWDHLYIVGRSREELGRLCRHCGGMFMMGNEAGGFLGPGV